MSSIVRFLSLVKIIPGGKSTLVDRIALILWTVVSVVLSAALLIVNRENIKLLSYKISVSSIFTVSSGFVNPCLNIVAIIPALHYLTSSYPHVLTDICLPSLQHSWLFLANVALCFSAPVASIWSLPSDGSVYFAVTLTAAVYWFSLMITSSLIIGISTSQIMTKMEKNALVQLNQNSASEILREFQELKAGMSPLLFMTFSSKCIIIISVWSTLLTYYPKPEYVIIVAYHMMDLFYLTTVLHHTYSTFKEMSLKLR